MDPGEGRPNTDAETRDAAKRSYEAPTLTRHGALAEVTAQGFSAINTPKDQLN